MSSVHFEDVTSPVSSAIDTVTQGLDLAAHGLGGWTPSGLYQNLLALIHNTTGLSFTLTIIATSALVLVPIFMLRRVGRPAEVLLLQVLEHDLKLGQLWDHLAAPVYKRPAVACAFVGSVCLEPGVAYTAMMALYGMCDAQLPQLAASTGFGALPSLFVVSPVWLTGVASILLKFARDENSVGALMFLGPFLTFGVVYFLRLPAAPIISLAASLLASRAFTEILYARERRESKVSK